jgi:hypothetical protein
MAHIFVKNIYPEFRPTAIGTRSRSALMASSNPRVGEIKFEEIAHRSITRKLDDSCFNDHLYSVFIAQSDPV